MKTAVLKHMLLCEVQRMYVNQTVVWSSTNDILHITSSHLLKIAKSAST